MRQNLLILWIAWWIGATLLSLGLLLLNSFRLRRVARRMDEVERLSLPTLREELLWAALVIVPGAVCMGSILVLLPAGHTARALLVEAIFGLVMLLGLAMLIKNGLAPTDSIGLYPATPDSAPASEPEDTILAEEVEYEQRRLRLRSGPMV